MRHRKKFNHLGRTASHRRATLANLASSLILHKRINTTVAKAKALKVYVEPLITKSKLDSTHSRRVVFSYLSNKHAVSELFREISQKIADRPGGYTRILRTGFRKGDGAEMCFIELVDYNLNMLKSAEESQLKRTRRGRARKKSEGEASAQIAEETATASNIQEETTEEVKAETKAEETAEPATETTKSDEIPEAAAEEVKPEAKEEPAKEEEQKEESKDQDVKAEKAEEKPQESESKESKDDEEKKAE